jgi:DNA-binding SARP family transcriptional activator
VRAETELLQITLFGQASLVVNGVALKLAKRATTLSLLACVILRRGAPVARSSLAYALFPDQSEEEALAELRRYLYLTNKALPGLPRDTWLLVEGETVRWNADAPCRIDVVEFERKILAAETRAEAVGLYTGELLEEIYEDWIVGERERLRGLCLDALAQLVREYRAARDYARGLASAQQLLRLDPWREDIVRVEMSLRYEAGDAAGALDTFARFAARLQTELGVAPMPETLGVRDAIVRHEPLPGALLDRREVARAEGARTALLPFVGRGNELAALRAAWTRAGNGHGSIAFLHGEAGVGKTRCAAELARTVEEQGGRVFVGGTSSPESMPYQALLEALRSGLPTVRASRFALLQRAALARVLPEWQPGLEVGLGRPVAESERETGIMLDALAEATLALARPRPALLVLEDLHWAGRATLDAVVALARRLEGAPLLVLVTFRDEEAGPGHAVRAAARTLRNEQKIATEGLERFERGEIAELLGRLDTPLDDAALVDRLTAYTEGNALFLNEALADAVERHGGSLAFLGVPLSGVSAVIAARVARLSDEARTVVEAAAVAGQGCSVEVIGEVVALTPAQLSSAFNELLDRRIVREASSRSGVDFAFTHHLIGSSIYAALAPEIRARRHARIAHVLQRVHPERPSAIARELATHFQRAGLQAEAAHWFGEAAKNSAAVYAGEDALALANEALQLESLPERRVELFRLREDANRDAGEREAQRADLEALESELGEAGDAEHFDLLRRRMLLARSLGESDVERGLLERMSGLAARANDAAIAAEVRRQWAAHAMLLSRPTEAREAAGQALAMFESLGDVAAQVECLGLLVEAETNAGHLVAAREHLNSLRGRASSLSDRASHARALAIAATAALLNQSYVESQELTREGLEVAMAIGDRAMEAASRARIAVIAARLGDFEVALHEFDRALAMFEALQNKRGLATTLTNKTMLAIRLGMFEEALVLIERSDSLLDVVQERRMVVANAVNASFAKLRLGDAAAAEERALFALEQARGLAFPVFEAAALSNLGNAERALGRSLEGIAHIRSGIAIRRPLQEPVDYADDLADLTLALIDAGQPSEARAVAAELSALDLSGPGPLWPHYAAWAASRGFAAAGETERAERYAALAREELGRLTTSILDETIRDNFLAGDIPQLVLRSAHESGTPLG